MRWQSRGRSILTSLLQEKDWLQEQVLKRLRDWSDMGASVFSTKAFLANHQKLRSTFRVSFPLKCFLMLVYQASNHIYINPMNFICVEGSQPRYCWLVTLWQWRRRTTWEFSSAPRYRRTREIAKTVVRCNRLQMWRSRSLQQVPAVFN